ncbi:MAG: gamma-butyrobetaine hydroxylase-like domain-containing protein [Terriglobales bacterium]
MSEEAPRSVDISLSEGVTIEWRDGHVSHYGIRYLRSRCPCATCTEKHGPKSARPGEPGKEAAKLLPIYKPHATALLGAERVGNYALLFHFSDRHATGIYTWGYLRQICRCEACLRSRGELGTEAPAQD